MNRLEIAVFAGDGIGPEVMEPCLALLEEAVSRAGGPELELRRLEAGADLYRRTGEAIPSHALEAAKAADAILLGAMGLPEVRYPDGREIAPQLDLREQLELFAGLRPVRSVGGLPGPLADPRAADLDLVILRESTEGLFAGRGGTELKADAVARNVLVITRQTTERLCDFAFELARARQARGRPGRVTCVDKANVLGAYAFFRRIFLERAERFPDVTADCGYVDAVAFNLVRRPWDYDVLVTENMFGDILSDVGAALMGGMGMAPSADVGRDHAVFQPCHGTAPDIAGRGIANPTAMLLSAALMLDWLGRRHVSHALIDASRWLEDAVDRAFAGDCVPIELGGTAGTGEIAAAVRAALDRVPATARAT